jgi:transcriptional regulator with XRE-family HTH domain
MKLTSHKKGLLLADLQRHRQDRGWTMSRLAKEAAIDQSQVSRIFAGNFKTLSQNIMQLCMAMDIELAAYHPKTRTEDDRNKIATTAISIWNGTHRDAEVVVSLLRDIAKLRKPSVRR